MSKFHKRKERSIAQKEMQNLLLHRAMYKSDNIRVITWFVLINIYVVIHSLILLRDTLLLAYLLFEAVLDLVPIQTDLLIINPDPINLDQKLLIWTLWTFSYVKDKSFMLKLFPSIVKFKFADWCSLIEAIRRSWIGVQVEFVFTLILVIYRVAKCWRQKQG